MAGDDRFSAREIDHRPIREAEFADFRFLSENFGMKKQYALLIILLLITLALAGCSKNKGVIQGEPADPNNLPDITGVYAVNGVDAGGADYSGTLKIEPGDSPGSYKLHWIVTGAIQEGEGSVEGNQLKARWRNIQGVTQSQGDIVYTITTLGELDGVRTIDGFDGEGWEKAFPNDETWGRFKLGH